MENRQTPSSSKLDWYGNSVDQQVSMRPTNNEMEPQISPLRASVQPSYRVLADIMNKSKIDKTEPEQREAANYFNADLEVEPKTESRQGLRRYYDNAEVYQNASQVQPHENGRKAETYENVFVASNANLVAEKPKEKNNGCSKWWLALFIPLILCVLAGAGVLIYFGICHWGGSCSKNSPTSQQCLNGGSMVQGKSGTECQCPDGVKNANCYCDNFPACCGDSLNVISQKTTFDFSQRTTFINGLCQWIFVPSNKNGGSLTLSITNSQFVSSSSCETDYVLIYNNSVVEDDDNLVGKYCQANQSDLAKLNSSSPTFSIVWSTTLKNHNVSLTFTKNNVDYCADNPCGSLGSCVSQMSNYFCTCPNGTVGSGPGTPCRSETICDLVPPICQNGGNCTSTSLSSFECTCTTKFSGQFCEIAT